MLVRTWAAIVLAVAGLIGFSTVPAHAADEIASYVVNGSVAPDGVLSVEATITPDGASELRQRFATALESGRDRRYEFEITDVAATVGGTAVTPNVSTDGDYELVTVPLSGNQPVRLSYKVKGAALDNGDGTTTVSWRLLQGLNLPVRSFDATIAVPGPFTMIDCRAGSPAAPAVCANFTGGTHDQSEPAFHDGPRGAGEVVQVVIRFPNSVVKPNQDLERRWTLDHAFSVSPLPLGAAVGTGLLGALFFWLMHRRFGRDDGPQADPIMVGGFRPVGDGQSAFRMDEDVRPGQVGTLVDERVDPVDITATMLDLAVHGHLLITEMPRDPGFKPTEWLLTRRTGVDALRPYERTLLDALAPEGEAQPLHDAIGRVREASHQVQDELYAEVVHQGWFAVRPDSTRTTWARAGWIALVLTLIGGALLIAFTEFGLLALVLVALALGLMFVAQAMPARTAKGAGVLQGLGILRGQLLTQPIEEMQGGRAYAELSRVLPYAVVLGGTQRWIDGLVAADDDEAEDSEDLDWYHGPAGWHLRDLPGSLSNFVRTIQGELFTR